MVLMIWALYACHAIRSCNMQQSQLPTAPGDPNGRGSGHGYMRAGEVHGGYSYSARTEYEPPRGELLTTGEHEHVSPTDELTSDDARPNPTLRKRPRRPRIPRAPFCISPRARTAA